MRADLAGLVAANEDDIKVFVVVGEIRRRGFRRGGAVTGKILAKIAYGEFHFAGTGSRKSSSLGARCTRGMVESVIFAAFAGGGASVGSCAGARTPVSSRNTTPSEVFRITQPTLEMPLIY